MILAELEDIYSLSADLHKGKEQTEHFHSVSVTEEKQPCLH